MYIHFNVQRICYIQFDICTFNSSSTALTEQICTKYNLQVHSIYNTTRGFYLQLYVGRSGSKKPSSSKDGSEGLSVEQLPREFVKVSKQRNYINFTTADLIRLNSKLKARGRRSFTCNYNSPISSTMLHVC